MIRGLLVGIVCIVPIVASGEKRAMTVDDMLDVVRLDDVVMTPDGSKVFYTERRLNWEISNWHIGGKHLTNREEWRRRSAIDFVEKVETPTLFLHGEEDQTSSTNQSMVYFDGLQERGVPTRF